MRTVKNWQTQARAYFLQKMMRKLERKRCPIPFEAAKSLGILFDATRQEDRELALSFSNQLKQKDRKIRHLGFFANKQDISNFPFKAFNKNEVDWLLRPKGDKVEEFQQEPFDFLISIYSKENLVLEYISALSQAHLRVGPYTDNTYCYDLMIDTAGNESLNDYLKQVSFYLNRLKSNSYETTTI